MCFFQPLTWALSLMTLVASAVAAPQKSTQSFSAEDLSFFAEGSPSHTAEQLRSLP